MKWSYGLAYLSLFFCVIIFSISVWLIRASNMNKKGIGFFSHSCFLEHLRTSLPSFCKFCVWTESMPSPGYQDSTYLVINITRLPFTCYECCWTPVHHGCTRVLCSWSIVNTVCKCSGRKSVLHTFPSDPMNVPLSY